MTSIAGEEILGETQKTRRRRRVETDGACVSEDKSTISWDRTAIRPCTSSRSEVRGRADRQRLSSDKHKQDFLLREEQETKITVVTMAITTAFLLYPRGFCIGVHISTPPVSAASRAGGRSVIRVPRWSKPVNIHESAARRPRLFQPCVKYGDFPVNALWYSSGCNSSLIKSSCILFEIIISLYLPSKVGRP